MEKLAGLSMSNASQVKHQLIFINSNDSSKKYTYTMTQRIVVGWRMILII